MLRRRQRQGSGMRPMRHRPFAGAAAPGRDGRRGRLGLELNANGYWSPVRKFPELRHRTKRLGRSSRQARSLFRQGFTLPGFSLSTYHTSWCGRPYTCDVFEHLGSRSEISNRAPQCSRRSPSSVRDAEDDRTAVPKSVPRTPSNRDHPPRNTNQVRVNNQAENLKVSA